MGKTLFLQVLWLKNNRGRSSISTSQQKRGCQGTDYSVKYKREIKRQEEKTRSLNTAIKRFLLQSEAEAGGSQTQGKPGLQVRPCLKRRDEEKQDGSTSKGSHHQAKA